MGRVKAAPAIVAIACLFGPGRGGFAGERPNGQDGVRSHRLRTDAGLADFGRRL